MDSVWRPGSLAVLGPVFSAFLAGAAGAGDQASGGPGAAAAGRRLVRDGREHPGVAVRHALRRLADSVRERVYAPAIRAEQEAEARRQRKAEEAAEQERKESERR